MAFPLIPLLVQLAGAVPTLMKYAGAGEASTQVAQEVVGVAQTITGLVSPSEAVKAVIGDPEKMNQFRLAVMEKESAWDQMFLADMQSARERDVKLHQSGYVNKRAHALAILAVIVVAVLFVAVWMDSNLNEFVKGVVTLILGRFLGYLDSIYWFEFGTTRQSRAKDSTIEALSKA